MAESISDLTEDAQSLQLTMQTHKDELVTKGFKDTRFQDFSDALNAVIKKSSTQTAAQSTMVQSTDDQNSAIKDAIAIAAKVQNAARSAFGKNKPKMKEFKVGTRKTRSVSQLSQLLDYLAGVCTKYHDELVENGMTADDFADLSSAYATLVTTDAVQEHSKKLRNVATDTRDDSVASLKDQMFKVRSFAKSAFAGNKALLEEFKPIKRGGKRGAATPPPPVPEPVTAQPAQPSK